MVRSKYSVRQRVFIYDSYVRTESARAVRRLFQEEYPGVQVPNRSTIHRLVNKFRETGSVLDRKHRRPRRVLTEETLDNVGHALERSPRKSVRRLSQQMGISYGSVQKATRLLKLQPYKITAVQELKTGDPAKRLQFCEWVLKSVHDGEIDPYLIFFSDESWFHLSGYVNSQNNRYWNSQKPNLIHEQPLHDQKIGLWCAISGERIIGPIFFQETINSERYMENILRPFFDQLTERERAFATFQQDSATAHTAKITLQKIQEVFQDRVITNNIWPPRSPDLTPCDFYLWGALKEKVYRSNPHTLDELKTNIRQEIAAISQRELQKVINNFLSRCQKCLNNEGRQFQHLLA